MCICLIFCLFDEPILSIFMVFYREFLFEIRLSRWTATSAASTLVLLDSSNNSSGSSSGSSSRDSGLSVNLYTELHYRSPTLVFSDSSRTFPIPGVSTALTAEEYIQQGCAAGSLVRDTLALLCEHKLRVLTVRLGATLSSLANSTIAKVRPVIYTNIYEYCIHSNDLWLFKLCYMVYYDW